MKIPLTVPHTLVYIQEAWRVLRKCYKIPGNDPNQLSANWQDPWVSTGGDSQFYRSFMFRCSQSSNTCGPVKESPKCQDSNRWFQQVALEVGMAEAARNLWGGGDEGTYQPVLFLPPQLCQQGIWEESLLPTKCTLFVHIVWAPENRKNNSFFCVFFWHLQLGGRENGGTPNHDPSPGIGRCPELNFLGT